MSYMLQRGSTSKYERPAYEDEEVVNNLPGIVSWCVWIVRYANIPTFSTNLNLNHPYLCLRSSSLNMRYYPFTFLLQIHTYLTSTAKLPSRRFGDGLRRAHMQLHALSATTFAEIMCNSSERVSRSWKACHCQSFGRGTQAKWGFLSPY